MQVNRVDYIGLCFVFMKSSSQMFFDYYDAHTTYGILNAKCAACVCHFSNNSYNKIIKIYIYMAYHHNIFRVIRFN